MKSKPAGGPLWLHWTRTAVLFLLAGEYARLVLTTDQPSYRVTITVILVVLFGISLGLLVRALRRRKQPPG
jgi:ABC-type transport system involved in cytochrome c biogenesis permease subunit